jgi:putative ABC transport system permease protein
VTSQMRALWRNLIHKDQVDRELDEELGTYLELSLVEKVEEGMTPEKACRDARIEVGGIEQVKQRVRDVRIGIRLERLAQDIRYGLRTLVKNPAFSLVAVATLALGIGANTVIYTLVDSILLRPLPFAQQNRLMRITGTKSPEYPKGWIRALGANSKAFASLAGFGADAESNVSDSGLPDRVFSAKITANALDTLGIHPALGGFFSADDAIAGEDNDVILSYGYWRQRFGGSPGVLGHTIRIDGVSRRIIGVMPAGVHFPYADTQFVIPVSFHRDSPTDPWTDFDLQMFGRLADGVTPARAQDELRRLHSVLLNTFPWRMPDVWASDMTVISLLEAQTGQIRPRLLLLFGAVGLILLTACANVANLMLARATAREREIAIRSALGASGRRLIQQLLSESVVLGITAGVVGLAAALASLRIFVRLLPADTPRIEDVSLHIGDILFTLGASVLAGLLFGLIPAIKVASMNLLSTLRVGGRGIVSRGATFGISMALVMAQIGLSVMVIASAGLMLHSLYQLSRVDPGFRTSGTVTAEIALDANACTEKGRCESFFQTLLESAQGVTGVASVGLVNALPLSGLDDNYVYDAENHPRNARQGALLATGRVVSPGYFDVLGLHLLRGRLLNAQDASGGSHAAVVNERMAQRLWPNQDPIGKHLLDVNDTAPAVWDVTKASVIVGVVRNTRAGSLAGEYNDEVYLPMTPAREQPEMYILLRSHTTPAATASGLRRAVAGIDAHVAVTRVRSLDQVVATSVSVPHALAILLLGFGSLAVVIGAIGVYSLISYIVSWRTTEIGLRLALGAQRWQIEMAVVRQSLLLAGGGCLAGLLGTFATSRLLHSFLFEVSALDPVTFCAVAALMGIVALAAAWIPARRAAAVDPMVALR